MANKTTYSQDRLIESVDVKICKKQIITFAIGTSLFVLLAIAFLLATRSFSMLFLALPFPVLYSPVFISALLRKKKLMQTADGFVFLTVSLTEWKKVKFRGYCCELTLKDKSKETVNVKTYPIAVATPFTSFSKEFIEKLQDKKAMVGYNSDTGTVVVVKTVW